MRTSVERVLVIGAGTMGTQIAAAIALAGNPVEIVDIADDALRRSETEVRTRLTRLREKDRVSDDAVAGAMAKLSWSTDLDAAAGRADFVIEAASERLDVKRDLFARLGGVAPPHAILVTNSSTIPSSLIAAASGRADRVCNMHFFNPALVMAAVEIVPNPDTSAATIDAVVALTERIGKTPIRLNREVPGFIANRLMNAIQDEATRLYADGVASLADIDRAATLALGHPMGPFELMDLVGLDVILLMHEAEAALTGDDSRMPHPLLVAHVEAGNLGRKTGHGWYDQSEDRA